MSNDSPIDNLLVSVDRALRAVFATPTAARPVPRPAAGVPGADETTLSAAERRESASLMRVNHAGEVAAQALYHGQAVFADHLAWCDQRLRELGSRPSVLGPLWYAGSFAIGAAAAVAGDAISLGFVSETERQVEGHIDSHLEKLPTGDTRSRAVLEQMRADEMAHGAAARAAGGAELPPPVQSAMRATARVMTTTSYWL
ncbi:MAG: 2-polyprenyl-3-methyl-6-methoxy-1,4-benzoquinone monooxygenase [Gammaproteobacteria bacterium]|nr:2-polyprenyl-3-methyl-6-methoxy-1,4-benzoquinone monooxygenase [Gammaproteobacteria bacterium]